MPAEDKIRDAFQEQADLFGIIRSDNQFAFFEMAPWEEAFAAVAQNPDDLETPKGILIDWVNTVQIPTVKEQLGLVVEQIFKTNKLWQDV